jgi:hypothetical protein
MFDIETYKDWFLVKFDAVPTGADYQMFPGYTLDIDSLKRTLSRTRVIGYNSENYDLPILSLALTGANNAQLKEASDRIIQRGLKAWQFYDSYNIQRPDWIDHIDLINVKPGEGSLKILGGKMHSRKMQDLPIDPSASIGLFDRCLLREYCGNDLQVTRDLWNTFQTQVTLREQMSAEYGVDLRSKSDAQIAEAVMKKLVPFKPELPIIPSGASFYYRPPDWIRFQTLDVLSLLARNPFTISPSGGIDMTPEYANTLVRIGQSAYQMGIGGLHSTENNVAHLATADVTLRDADVGGYYPELILALGIEPAQLKGYFQPIYRRWYEERTAAKRAGNKKVANSRKIINNGTFGKLGNRYSVFYAPSELIQVTVSGQLCLLMLIEALELNGISVVSANTDGIVIKAHVSQHALRDEILAWWCKVTTFNLEYNDYALLASRDVNAYLAIKTDGTVKSKGAYAPPEPGASGWPNPTGGICATAIVEYLTRRTPLEMTICGCTDIREFVHVRQVRGGGIWNGEYLGKAVRWYYATEGHAILTSKGDQVATSSGCRPVMQLPDVLPNDVDYGRYLDITRKMMLDIGIQPA